MVCNSIFSQYSDNQGVHGGKVTGEKGRQTCLQPGREPLHEPGHENAEDINIIYDDSLNAFASGINERTYTVTLSQGIIEKLDDEELQAVIAHELSHIRNHDVRLLIVSIVFVGVFSMVAQIAFRSALSSGYSSRKSENKGGTIIVLLLAAVVAAIGYLLATLMRFAISRKREYLADAGSAEMTKNPRALASALRAGDTDEIRHFAQKGISGRCRICRDDKESPGARLSPAPRSPQTLT